MIDGNKVIKITDDSLKNPIKNERAFRKQDLKVSRRDTFKEPIIDVTEKQITRLRQFINYCESNTKCVNCNGDIGVSSYHSNDDNDLVIKCENCLYNLIDSSKETREHIIWFNNILDGYGMSFKNGFPKLIRYPFMGKRKEYGMMIDHKQVEFIDFRGD